MSHAGRPSGPLRSRMSKKYLVTLSQAKRAMLGQRVSSGRGRARQLTRARILLKSAAGLDGPGWTDGAIAEALDVSRSTVERVRRRFAVEGLGCPRKSPHSPIWI